MYDVFNATYLDLRMLQDMADRRCSNSPVVQSAIRLQTYMNDICVGADILEEARELQRIFIQSLKLYGFELKKWSNNTP